LQPRAQSFEFADGAAQLRLEELRIGAVVAFQLRDVLQHLRGAVSGEDPLEDALHGELARHAARGCLHRPIAFNVLAISTATRADSAPLTGARVFACSSVSVVSTALATGIP